jgi:hypothetical protein
VGEPDRGAQEGIDAGVLAKPWPRPADLTLRHLLPLAARGLERLAVDPADASRLLSIIEGRCLLNQNGASWQVDSVHRLQERGLADRGEALRLMTQDYIGRMNSKEPVHTWPIM